MACLFLRSTLTPVSGGLMSEWHWTQLTGAENQRNGKSLRACIKRKKTYPAAASYSMQHSRLSASWMKSFAMSELRLDSERPKRFALIHFLICYSRSAPFSFIRPIYLLYLLKHLKCFILFII